MTRLPKTPVHRSRSPLLPRLGAAVAVALASAGIVMVAEMRVVVPVGQVDEPSRGGDDHVDALVELLDLPLDVGLGLLRIRQLAKSQVDDLVLALVQHVELDRVAGRKTADGAGEFTGILDLFAVHRGDHVTDGQTGLVGG